MFSQLLSLSLCLSLLAASCAAGYYTDSTGTEAVCRPLTICDGESIEVQAPTSSSNRVCSNCTFNQRPNIQTDGSVVCTTCPAGSIGTRTECVTCAAGKYAGPRFQNEPGCPVCPFNTYNPTAGQTGCIPCAAGLYSFSYGNTQNTSCQSCAHIAGPMRTYTEVEGVCSTFAIVHTCLWNQRIETSSGNVTCVQCPAGRYRDQTNVCVPCTAGTYAGAPNTDQTVQTSCPLCPFNTYASLAGQETCSPCPADTYAPSRGNIAETACHACSYFASAGLRGVIDDAGDCTVERCPPGTFSTGNTTTCTNCEAGHYASGTNSTFCSQCPVGTYRNLTSSGASCTNCPTGHYAAVVASSFCLPCPIGTYRGMTNAGSACVNCPAGYYANVTGAGVCLPCPAGTFSSERAGVCIVCLGAEIASAAGSADCMPCVGNTVPNPSHTECVAVTTTPTSTTTASSTTTSEPTDSDSGTTSSEVAAIAAGSTVGGLVFIGLLVVGVMFMRKGKQRGAYVPLPM